MNKRQRKKRAKKQEQRWRDAIGIIGEASTTYIRFMLQLPSPLTMVSLSFDVETRPVAPFGTNLDDEGVVHRTGLTPENSTGDTWLVRFCAPDRPIVGQGDPSTPVTCLACVAL